ncbi:hypothetical protein [Paenibacillus sp. 1001270B_150601_E10]|uniref:hypothetical protein n=1 Tax=Paenibacillus sp. 1001270B_150601_E10 TaxID=2787079 RepID=UPI00189DB306|nr:hypothetical protein [Paenibacillus sp. 1001270B_150601_E10]
MIDLPLTHSFALVALNAQRSLELTTAKKVALRCIAAAAVLEVYLDNGFTPSGHELTLNKEALIQAQPLRYRDFVLQALDHKGGGSIGDLKTWLRKASMLPTRKLKQLEDAIFDSLKEMGLLEEIPHLLACDLYFHTSGVKIKEYRSELESYSRITEHLRADILEDGQVTDETISMLWLLRESGSMHDLFSRNELEKVSARMYALYQQDPLAQSLYTIRIHRGTELAIKQFLRMKKAAIKTPVGSGLNFIFPVLERSQAIFIDTEKMFPNAEARLRDVVVRLESNGHKVIVVRDGDVPALKIDNRVYNAIPHAEYGRVPIHGVRLIPRLPF